MNHSTVLLEGPSIIDPSTILQCKVSIYSIPNQENGITDGESTILGERNIVEDLTTIKNSKIGSENLIGIRCKIENCVIGNNCTIRPGVQLENCKVGNNCVVTTGISLKNVEIPSNSTIFQTESGWNRKEVGDNSLFRENFHSYYEKLKGLSAP